MPKYPSHWTQHPLYHEHNPSFMAPLVKVQAAASIQNKPYPCHQCPSGMSALQQGLSQASPKTFQHPAALSDGGQAGRAVPALLALVLVSPRCHAGFLRLSPNELDRVNINELDRVNICHKDCCQLAAGLGLCLSSVHPVSVGALPTSREPPPAW